MTNFSGRKAAGDRRRTGGAKRQRLRDAARLMLVVSVLVLGVLAVEISRKAITIISHGSPQASAEITG
ncbi:hypothetical protein [Azospirillum picis]|uniref:Uncharacterized protein n=1 Tax=Azospirillum picis TaxID=488438 RepID=A0ABU0MQT3_9PROT|nr:hypothetical protein [Azospirillum picis]MBP2302256.1 hypothetical protein [Azospirillum picis]MDQ0535835.1 hypothetical protein [Azospirillum picis]